VLYKDLDHRRTSRNLSEITFGQQGIIWDAENQTGTPRKLMDHFKKMQQFRVKFHQVALGTANLENPLTGFL
jgi:hypothetical protein